MRFIRIAVSIYEHMHFYLHCSGSAGQNILRLVLLLPARTRHEASNGMDDPTCFVNLYVKKQKNI